MAVVQQQTPKTAHVDLPELREIFADSVHTMVWDGLTLRVEFCVTRYPETPSPSAEARRYPACRLVLTAPAAADFFNRLQQTMAAAKGGAAPAPPAQA